MFVLMKLFVDLLFEVGVDAPDQAIRTGCNLQDADLVAEMAPEIEADVCVEVVQRLNGQQPACGVVTAWAFLRC